MIELRFVSGHASEYFSETFFVINRLKVYLATSEANAFAIGFGPLVCQVTFVTLTVVRSRNYSVVAWKYKLGTFTSSYSDLKRKNILLCKTHKFQKLRILMTF